MVSYIANTLIFIFSGVVIAEGILHSGNHFEKHGTSWGYLVLLYVFVQLSRAIVVVLLYPFLRYFGYRLDWKESIILVWSGLRGAVALALSLSVKRASSSLHSSNLKPEVGTLFVFFTGGIVFLTLIVNGSTAQFFLHLLQMDKLSAEKIRVLKYTRYEMLNKALEAFGDLGDDEELGPADWPTVKKYITCLNDLDEGPEHPFSVLESESHLHTMKLRDLRIRLLNGVQAAYWRMLEEGRITQGTAITLMQSVDEAMDRVLDEPVCDWKGLKVHVHFPCYYRFLQIRHMPQCLVTYFTVGTLESACYISAAFLRAHRIARRQLHEFIGENEIASIVIGESNKEGEEAKKFLEDVHISFPQVLRVVKTKQVTHSILMHLSNYVQNLEKIGLLEEKETLHLDIAVQTDLKKLLRNPPLVKMPTFKDLLSIHPFLGALPSTVRSPLEGSAKQVMKIRGVLLYKEGSKPHGIWLMLNGVVEWASKGLRIRHSLHPTFSHGTTLGLYEVLVGKPYICDMITDSVVHCFFIESAKILELLRSDSAVEDFLWQESAIVIAKLLLPQIFEKMTLQQLRALVAEKSTMNSYIRGEIIELPQNSICFLLEGFIKAQASQLELISSPASLFSPQADLSSLNLGSSGVNAASPCHQGSCYIVETRARVITFDVGALDSENAPQRHSSSWVLHPAEFPRSQSKEHSGLMSWPEHFYKAKAHHSHPTKSDLKANSLSAKAMELSIFGSTVNDNYRRHQSLPGTTHSMSYPLCPPMAMPTHQLMPVQSGGGSLNKSYRAGEITKFPPVSQVPPRSRKFLAKDNSSDESSGEEEVIVRIDSPSRISFHQASGNSFPTRER
uniref:Sodium/hydrogen exchanger 7 n=2 Tax=Anthurium amnicola TaxID=1678845 RepID=A0A1D1ZC97_9ARAE